MPLWKNRCRMPSSASISNTIPKRAHISEAIRSFPPPSPVRIIQKRIRQDTRGMRRKARRADKDDESGDRRDEKASEERITKEG